MFLLIKTTQNSKLLNGFLQRNLNLTRNLNDKNLKKQGKMMQKFLGGRISGSRKWHPNVNEGFQQIKFPSNPSNNNQQNCSKHNIRRINVLNKLFMTNITDLMATSSISETIHGKGIQITSVKMSSDFTHLNILWTSKDNGSETEILNKCGGILRHELSQLRVMGEVPRITFIKDKTNENLSRISELLKTIDFEECYLDDKSTEKYQKLEDLSIKHDVFGLDRQDIMNKIRAKLKKSTDAWKSHKTNLDTL